MEKEPIFCEPCPVGLLAAAGGMVSAFDYHT